MGGCCCCASKGAETTTAPAYYYFPRVSEESVPLSSARSTVSAGLLVDTNLDTSIPDTYRPPPAPLPFSADVRHSQNNNDHAEDTSDKNDGPLPTVIAGSVQKAADVNNQDTLVKSEDKNKPDSKTDDILILDSIKELEAELSKPIEHLDLTAEEEECPICLEDYDLENPKYTTQCEHHFHLACILEWMERSEICPVCDKEITLETTIG